MPKKDDAKDMQAETERPTTERVRDSAPDDMQTPKNSTARGDAEPMPDVDPLLAPEAQRAGESYEDWQKRVGEPKPEPGIYDKTVTRGQEPG